MPGYPLQELLKERVVDGPVRLINGGVLTGKTINESQTGLDTECTGLTVLRDHSEREMLGFARPGWSRRSYSNCFLSKIRGVFQEHVTTALRGEHRPCVSCGFCEEICPVGIMPYLIHKLIYQDELEEAERARADLCISCGLCSYVCPSKIELMGEILAARETIQRELHVKEVEA